jgi:hypothetical protein
MISGRHTPCLTVDRLANALSLVSFTAFLDGFLFWVTVIALFLPQLSSPQQRPFLA